MHQPEQRPSKAADIPYRYEQEAPAREVWGLSPLADYFVLTAMPGIGWFILAVTVGFAPSSGGERSAPA